ncbi:hypothetical protein [Ktedonobacter robiniae]|uniref:Uncharacterized protein n=1 Tax=Ktedonobacter robiniae TaxID=2778365 RepID=A0ABQ3UL46_9CHLR|nr:hypothetical protein [Ktedonobacter robiniae]GHO53112.1 hypothetical protein KSB_15870 [Ktedonobacter robiniae]
MQKPKVTDTKKALQGQAPADNTALSGEVKVVFPEWPSSRPGPRTTPSPTGMKPINAIRREQVTEVEYNQETGVSEIRGAEEKTSPFIHKKPKQRL